MNISEMHVSFRQYAQQMGMQNVRAILPEQIDSLINQAIVDRVNNIIHANIDSTNYRTSNDNSKIGQINALRTLYDIKEVEMSFDELYIKTTNITRVTVVGANDPVTTTEETKEYVKVKEQDTTTITINGEPATVPIPPFPEGITIITKITYSDSIGSPFEYFPENRLQGLIKHVHQDVSPTDTDDNVFGKCMHIIGLSINYIARGNDDILTAWYPIRIIDSAFLSDTLNDFILKNRFRTPIACIYKNDTLELYIDKFAEGDSPEIDIKSGITNIKLIPNKLRIDLIKYPQTVKYVEDISIGSSVDCDLPEFMHGDIVRDAVDLYRTSIAGNIFAAQEQAKNQARENIRNNIREE